MDGAPIGFDRLNSEDDKLDGDPLDGQPLGGSDLDGMPLKGGDFDGVPLEENSDIDGAPRKFYNVISLRLLPIVTSKLARTNQAVKQYLFYKCSI